MPMNSVNSTNSYCPVPLSEKGPLSKYRMLEVFTSIVLYMNITNNISFSGLKIYNYKNDKGYGFFENA